MDLNAQIAELLSAVRVGGCLALAALVTTVGCNLVTMLRLRRLEERQARIETWQAKHGPPLERLAIEQDASEDPARAVAVKRPQRGGSREAPL